MDGEENTRSSFSPQPGAKWDILVLQLKQNQELSPLPDLFFKVHLPRLNFPYFPSFAPHNSAVLGCLNYI